MSHAEPAVTLFRPVGQKELDLIKESDWRRFPPRLHWQPVFYPVLNEDLCSPHCQRVEHQRPKLRLRGIRSPFSGCEGVP